MHTHAHTVRPYQQHLFFFKKEKKKKKRKMAFFKEIKYRILKQKIRLGRVTHYICLNLRFVFLLKG